MDDKRLDDAIDRAVREMMEVEPRPGIRYRVTARLQSQRPARLTIPRLAAALAIGLVILVLVLTRQERTSESVLVDGPPPASSPVEPEAPRLVRAQPAPAPSTPRSVPGRRAPDVGVVQAASVEPENALDIPVQLQAIESISLIRIEDAGPQPIVTSAIPDLEDLSIRQLDVAPLIVPR